MKTKIFFLAFLALFAFFVMPQKALCFTVQEKAALERQVQILVREINNLKSLIAASRAKGSISSTSYVAVDLESGDTIIKKNETVQYPIASVTKLMTAVVVQEKVSNRKKITITPEMLAPYGSSPAIYEGLRISAKDLLYASLTQSTNDAAESLSYFLGKEKFLAAMNKKASKLGMDATVYADVTGLDAKSRSTAADLAKLLAYVYEKDEKILDITKNNDFWLPDATGTELKFQNMNDFYPYPGFVGGKTGYLPEARQTFASIFDIDGKPVAIVVLNSKNYQADTFKIIDLVKKDRQL